MNLRLRILALVALTAACGPQAPKFANRGPTKKAKDTKAIDVPESRAFIEELYQADVYVRRELVNGLDPRRVVHAADANSHDEVVWSSWYVPRNRRTMRRGYERDGPPKPPFKTLKKEPSSGTEGAVVIEDARGLAYELVFGTPDRPQMRPAAGPIASRIFYALGYRTAEVHLITTPEGKIAGAMRWPVGVDLGPTPIGSTRADDPNDIIPHLDRRSLRALKLVTAWLGMTRLRPQTLRDVYVGMPGRGHVEHQVVALDGALGVDTYNEAKEFAENPDREDSNFFLKLFSMGLSPKPPGILPKTAHPALGLLTEYFLVKEFSPSPPFEPIDRLLPEDIYWAGKRIAAIPVSTLRRIIAAGKLPKKAADELEAVLHKRRASVIAWAFDQTTPCEMLDLRATSVTVADKAIINGFVPPQERSYEVAYVNRSGDELAPNKTFKATATRTKLAIPKSLRKKPYVIVRITAQRKGLALPRPLDIHLRPTRRGSWRAVGLRH